VDFEVLDRSLTRYSRSIRYLKKKREYDSAVHKVCIILKKARDSVMKWALWNVIGFVYPLYESG